MGVHQRCASDGADSIACVGTLILKGIQLNGGLALATNTGKGSRHGAVRDRFQLLDVATGLFVVFCAATGEILRIKRSPGHAKGISKRLPRKYRSG